jgi:hypothetical protein
MRHTFANLLLQDVYAHWLPDASSVKLVDALDDDAAPRGSQTAPSALDAEDQKTLSALNGVVSLNFTSWNQTGEWLRRVEALRYAA